LKKKPTQKQKIYFFCRKNRKKTKQNKNHTYFSRLLLHPWKIFLTFQDIKIFV